MTYQKPIHAGNPAASRRHNFSKRVLATVLVVSAGVGTVVLARAQKPMPEPQLKTAATQTPNRSDDTTRQMETLSNSSRHLQELRAQSEEAQEKHARLLEEFLNAVDRNPSQWSLRILQDGKPIGESPWTPPIHELLLAAASSRGPSPGGGAGCPDRVGCANTGQLGNKCFYICKTVAR
jgi:hypothetical protein